MLQKLQEISFLKTSRKEPIKNFNKTTITAIKLHYTAISFRISSLLSPHASHCPIFL